MGKYQKMLASIRGLVPANRTHKKLWGRDTYAHRYPDGTVEIVHHNTAIIVVTPQDRVEVNTGGWYSVSTKDRLNYYLRPIHFFQQNNRWFVTLRRKDVPFQDGMVIGPGFYQNPTKEDQDFQLVRNALYAGLRGAYQTGGLDEMKRVLVSLYG